MRRGHRRGDDRSAPAAASDRRPATASHNRPPATVSGRRPAAASGSASSSAVAPGAVAPGTAAYLQQSSLYARARDRFALCPICFFTLAIFGYVQQDSIDSIDIHLVS